MEPEAQLGADPRDVVWRRAIAWRWDCPRMSPAVRRLVRVLSKPITVVAMKR